ncbi:hypothetical protein MT418_006616 [Batrachochytrium dendrobatidis]
MKQMKGGCNDNIKKVQKQMRCCCVRSVSLQYAMIVNNIKTTATNFEPFLLKIVE